MKHYDEKQMQENILYLEALSEQYPNIQSAAAEMINLHAILDLPKGTEHKLLNDIGIMLWQSFTNLASCVF